MNNLHIVPRLRIHGVLDPIPFPSKYLKEVGFKRRGGLHLLPTNFDM
jgi:hypothetical protein